MPQAAPPAPSAPAVSQKPKGAIGIWIGVLLIIGGIILGIVLVVTGVRSLVDSYDDLQRFPIGEEGVVRVEEPGTQTIFAERPSSGSVSSNSFSVVPPNVALRVIGPGGADVNVTRGGSTETYDFNGREGTSIGKFYASTSGTYRVISQIQDTGPWSTLAVGTGLDFSNIGAILAGVFGGGLVVLVGIVVVIIFAVRRSRSKKRLVQASSPYPSAYGAGGGSWPAAPGYAPPGAQGYAPPGAPGGYGAPPAPGAYGAPAAAAGWGAPDNAGWAPPPVVQPGPPPAGPAWTPPQTPPPQAPPSDATWQPAAPAVPPPWQPGGEPPAAPADPPPPADPLAPSWDPPAGSDAPPPPPPPPSGDGSTPS